MKVLDSYKNPVTIYSKVIIILFVLYASFMPDSAGKVFKNANTWLWTNLNWFYIWSVAFFLIFAIFLSVSKYRKIKLGKDDEKPEFNYWSWIAMLFGAGLGIGLIFWSIAEPILHYSDNPWISAEMSNADKAQLAMQITIYHWAFHPWAVYVITGLSMAYFCFRKDLPLTVSSTLSPILGKQTNGLIGKFVDIIAIFATIFGVATSLGFGVSQIAKGLNILTGLEFFATKEAVYGLIFVITAVAIYSSVTGVKKGIRILSEWNLWLSFVILLTLFILGPTIYLFGSFFTNIGYYVVNVLQMSVEVIDISVSKWQTWWTIFYWGWWVSWAPFVGMFIARISRGRTIGEFIFGVLFVSSFISIIWLTIFGNTALWIEMTQGGILDSVKTQGNEVAMYATFQALNYNTLITTILSVLGTILIVTYFVTSADSGTLVLSTLSSGGNIHPPKEHRISWGVLEALVASVLITVGGLGALQQAAILVALPFMFIMWLIIISLMKALMKEKV